MKGKVAIITGSSQGIGKTLAVELAKKGAKVVLNGRNGDRLNVTHQSLLAQGFDMVAVQGDISNHADCQKLINSTIEHYGKIDILVNNAGLSMEGEIETLAPDTLKKIMEVNVLGSVYPTQLALPQIKATKGNILFISSLAGIHGLPNFSAYSASKMALSALAESLKIELSGTGVHVGIAYVGFTENDPQKTFYNANGELEVLPKRQNVKVEAVEKVAQRLIRKIEKRKFKTTFSTLGKLLSVINRISPSLVERILSTNYRNK